MEYLKKALKDSFDKIFISFSTYTDIESGNGNKIRIENNINFYNAVTTIYFIRKDENDNRDIISILHAKVNIVNIDDPNNMDLEIENLEDYINEIDALVSNHISNSDLLDNPFRIATFYSDESDMSPELLYKLNHRENDLNRTYFTDNCIKYENKIYNDPEDIVNIIYNLMINEAATIVELRFKCYNSAIQKDIQTYLTFDIQPNTINCPRYSIFGWRQYTTDSESYICTKIRNIEYSQILPNQDLRYLKKKKGIAKKVYNITIRSIKESFEFIDSITDISKPTQCEIFYS